MHNTNLYAADDKTENSSHNLDMSQLSCNKIKDQLFKFLDIKGIDPGCYKLTYIDHVVKPLQ